MQRKITTPAKSPARGAAVTFTDLPMYPFTYSAAGTDAATDLAFQAAHVEQPEYNLPLIELISGIAAIEDAEDRHIIAFDAIKTIFAFTPDARASMLASLKQFHKKAAQ